MRNELKEMRGILGDVEIDVYSLARFPKDVSKEKIFETLATLKKEGWFKEIGASEISATSLEEMHKVGSHPLARWNTEARC